MKAYLLLTLFCTAFVIISSKAHAQIIRTIAGGGPVGLSGGPYSNTFQQPECEDIGDGGPAINARIGLVKCLAYDNAGNLYLAEGARVRKIDASGIITTYAGNGTLPNNSYNDTTGVTIQPPGYSGDGGLAINAQVFAYALAVNDEGDLYISDVYNNVVRKVSAATGIITTVAGNGYVNVIQGYSYGGGYSGDGGPATAAELDGPLGMTVDHAGNLYITDRANQRIRKVDATTGIITTVVGNGYGGGYGGNGGYNGDNIPATSAELSLPDGVAVDNAGNLYIMDAGNHRVRKVSASTGMITTVAGNGGSSVDTHNGPAATVEIPDGEGIAIDAWGNLYIPDVGDEIISKIDTGGYLTIVAGNELASLYPNAGGDDGLGDDAPATHAALNFAPIFSAMQIAVDCSGNIYIPDQASFRIRKVGDSVDHAPVFSGGHTQSLFVCYNTASAVSIDTLLSAGDIDTGQHEEWAIESAPAHGTVAASYFTFSTGGMLLPQGLTYTPSAGYTGIDSFKIMISDCVSFDTTTIYVHYLSAPSLTSVNNGCNDQASGIAWVSPQAGDTTTHTYQWLNSEGSPLQVYTGNLPDTLAHLDTGSYSVKVINLSGCDTTLSFTITPSDFGGSSQLKDTTICQGSSIQFENNIVGSGLTYYWNFGDGSAATQPAPIHTYSQPGIYLVQSIISNGSCQDTIDQKIIVDTLPVIKFTVSPDTVCEGSNITLNAQYTTGVQSLYWHIADTIFQTTALSSFQYAISNSNGFVPVLAISGNPYCPDISASSTMLVYPAPLVDLGNDTTLCPGQPPIVLRNLTSLEDDYRNYWNTTDIGRVITVTDPGLYWLTATTNMGCTASDSILISPNCYVGIPDAFTPNGDGINDYFFPASLFSRSVTMFHMAIYSRWGQLMYETNNINDKGWDGKFNGVIQTQSVFVYFIEATYTDGTAQKYTGNVSLLR